MVDRAGFEPATFRSLDRSLVCKPDVLRPDNVRQYTRLNYRPTQPENPPSRPVKAFDEKQPLNKAKGSKGPPPEPQIESRVVELAKKPVG